MKKNWTVVLFLLFSIHSFGQESQFTVEYITIQNGLSDNDVNTIIKGKTGFMWFGTNDGISRFDGYRIKNFKPSNEFLIITDLLQTNDGLLWCASSNGLHCFDPETEQFIASLKPDNNNPESLPSNSISGIVEGRDNTLWVSTDNGLCHISNINRQQLKKSNIKIKVFNTSNSSIPSNELSTILLDKNNILWIGSLDPFLFTFNTKNQLFKKIPISVFPKPRVGLSIFNTLYNDNNVLWIGTIGAGLVKLDKETYDIKIMTRGSDFDLSHEDIYGIQIDSEGNLWTGTWNGIDKINALNGTLNNKDISHYNWDHPLFNENLENRISTLYWDNSGVMWVGTFGGGVVKINISNTNYKRYKFDSRFEVKSIIEDNDGYLWITMYHGGIKKSIQKTSKPTNFTFKNFKKEQPNSSINSNVILCSAKDLDGTIWFGSNQSTLYKVNKSGTPFGKLVITPVNEPNWKGEINKLCIDTKGDFWIATNNGLVYYNTLLKNFHVIKSSPLDKYSLNHDNIKSVFEDSKGNIWVGTRFGVNKLINQTGTTFKFNNFNDIYIPDELLYNKEVWSIYEDKNANLWFGYRGGLGELNSFTGEIQIYNTTHGLPNNFVSCITEDDHKNLWIGTNSGITKFNIITKTFENYYIANNNRAAYKDSFGNLYFGNNNGFLSFHPDNIKKNTIIPPVIISDLRINNKSINIDENINKQTILKKSVQHTNHITLNYLNQNFALEFTSLSFPFQEFNNYSYKLEGFQKDWNFVNSRSRVVSFNNLTPGNYTFMVKAANNDGVWNEEPKKLSITIEPAWWNTFWARSLFFIGIFSILILAYYLRIRQIHKKQEQASIKLKHQHNLKIAKLEKKKEKELSEIKSKFFTNLSHEIRTPLTLIISPLQDLLNASNLPSKLKKELKPIEINANRLLKLVNQLLDFRKIVTEKMKLKISEENINIQVKNVFKAFNPLAKSNNIKYKFTTEKKPFNMWFDVNNIEIVITNLLSNAFKFTPKNGRISISINEITLDGIKYCRIVITNSGKGISKKDQRHLFERYYQMADSNANFKGSGIGLSIVKEIIDLHKGKISLVSSIGKETSFKILLPVNKEIHPSDFIINSQEIKDKQNIISESQIEVITSNQSIKNETILIVEDNSEILNYIKSIFIMEYNILEASNGQEGFKIATKHLPNLIISDIMMPIMDGINMCQKLKRNSKTSYIPVILLTAKAHTTNKIEGLKIGADDYITKPFESHILKAKVDSFIENRKKLKDFFEKKITLEPTDVGLESHEEKFLKSAIDLIEQNLMNPLFSVDFLAENLNMSQATLYRKVKNFTNLSISQFIRSIRIKRAAQLLKLNDYSIGEIANMVGFSDAGYFRKCFVKQFNVNPSQYPKEEG